jgi:beta-lactamase superfamily II metal-dependent hydrolase
MYRVGFGDFFLLTVPGNNGPAHILIDCGVHAANIGSMDACIQNLKAETNGRLALVILTHYHADHMSGFASNYDDFTEFEVGAVWITNRLDPQDDDSRRALNGLTAVANQLRLHLSARNDEAGRQAMAQVENALGFELGAAGAGSNAKALKLLQEGFKNKPKVFYYQGGDQPYLPPELEGQIEARLLAPSPRDSPDGEFAASDNKREQYLTALGESGIEDPTPVRAFDECWTASAADYPPEVFAGVEGGHKTMEEALKTMRPDVLAATADKLDGTLNNQSLVVLFTCRGKRLLFVGDAQWGNWAYWLYGRKVTGKDPGISDEAKGILGAIDFYKVGHHGSTNATPIPAVAAMSGQCAAMCSTAVGAYGNPARGTEVPRTTLLGALEKQLGNRLVRSDWVAANGEPPAQAAVEGHAELPHGFSSPGQLYIDYVL